MGLAAGLPFGRPLSGESFDRSRSTASILVSDRLCGNLLPGLGPPRSAQQETRVTAALLQKVRRDRFRRDGSPNGVAWRYPDWTAVGFRFKNPRADKGSRVPAKGLGASAANRGCDPSLPDPIPRICPTFAGRYQPAASSWVRRPGCRKDFPSRSEAPRAATVTRIAFGRFTGH